MDTDKLKANHRLLLHRQGTDLLDQNPLISKATQNQWQKLKLFKNILKFEVRCNFLNSNDNKSLNSLLRDVVNSPSFGSLSKPDALLLDMIQFNHKVLDSILVSFCTEKNAAGIIELNSMAFAMQKARLDVHKLLLSFKIQDILL